jgi:antagonist of KipI
MAAAVAGIKILSGGLQTTIQDIGRFGLGHYGVPPSGALDSFSLRIANLLVGNPETQPCFETTLMGLRFKALADMLIAVTGADLRPQIDKRSFEMWCSRILKKGKILSFAGPKSGCRAYVAFGGKLNIRPLLGSRSTNLPAGFGGLKGRALQKGDIFLIEVPPTQFAAEGRSFEAEQRPLYAGTWTLRVIWGPQDNDFSEDALHTFIHSEFTVSPQSDRSGIRLNGPSIQRKSSTAESIISEGLLSGSVQVPGDGQPIIILGETVTGGYRKIATIISADLPLTGQIKPGDKIRFQAVTLKEACRRLREKQDMIEAFKGRFEMSSPRLPLE